MKRTIFGDFYNTIGDDYLQFSSNVRYELRTNILKRLNTFFKKWLKNQEVLHGGTKKKICFSFCIPTNKSLKEIAEWKIKWVMAFKVKIRLLPRYKLHWDGWEFEFIFEIKLRENRNTFLKTVSPYCFDASNPKKEEITTNERDTSIERSRKAYRLSLMRVVRWFK